MSSEPCEVGILFGDVAGSTRLYENLGDARAHAAVNAALAIMSEATRQHGGVVVKTVGDEVMAAFFRAEPMIEAAIDIQRRLAAAAPLDGPGGTSRLKVRIGFHFGPAIREGGDYFGNTVNAAARMVALAKGDEIITTMDVRSRVGKPEQERFRQLENVTFRGMSEETPIAEILWQVAPELTQLPDIFRNSAQTPSMQRLHLAYMGKKWNIDPRMPPFSIGREPENTLIIPDSRVSRRHATIERRLTSWVLFDYSSNGTFVTFGGNREIVLRRQEMILHGSGHVCFGHAYSGTGSPVLTFSISNP